jgi:hypothetical protein
MLSRRSLLVGALAASSAIVVPSIVMAQALPSSPIPVPYSPQTRIVSFPTAANDNLSGPQRLIANQQMTKTAIGIKSSGAGRTVMNRALTAIGKVARVARVGGPWGLLASLALTGLTIYLGDGSTFDFGNILSGPNSPAIAPGTANSTFYMTYPYYSSVLDMPMGVTIARNSQSNPSGITAYYRFDVAASPLPPSTLSGGWSRHHLQYVAGPPAYYRATYSIPITTAQIQSGYVLPLPPLPSTAIQPTVNPALTVGHTEADKLHQALVKHALQQDAAANGANAAYPGYTQNMPLPFAWPQEVPTGSPQTVGDWQSNWPSIPPAVDPNTAPWEMSQGDYDTLPTINPSTGTSTNPNPGTNTDPAGNPLPIPTGAEVTPDSGGELPGFMDFVNPFNNLFDPFKNALGGIDGSCPTLTIPSISTSGWFGGSATTAYPVTAHCATIEPMRGAIIAAGTAIGAMNAIDHILEA